MAYFDPYHKWLGIPPDEQPPDHYRLLGIQRFEADPDVIEAAADQRMAHLRTYQAGKHSELSQRLLNEVATAKVCLLKLDKKAAYDVNLKEQEAATDLTSQQGLDRVKPNPAPLPPEPAPIQIAPVLPQVTSGAPTRRVARRPRSKRAAPAAILLVTGVLLFGAIGLAFLLSGPSSYEAPTGRASSGSDQLQRENVNTGRKAAVTNKEPAVKPLASPPTRALDGSETAAPKVTEFFPVMTPAQTKNRTDGKGELPQLPVTTSQLPLDLILYLTFEPDTFIDRNHKRFVQDVASQGNVAEVIGAVQGEGKRGKGLYFDGESDSVILRDFNQVKPCTFSVWVKPEEKHDSHVVLSSRVMGVKGSGIRFHINEYSSDNRVLEFAIPHPRRSQIAYSRRKVNTRGPVVRWAEWQHLALVMQFNPNRVELFHNARKVAQGNNLVDPVLAPGPWRLGTYMDRPSDYHGNMDEVMLFARALSEKEIRSVYELGLQADSP